MNYQKGLSLVELMIAITLGLILMAGVMQLFISSKNTYRTQMASSRVQETGRMALEFLSRDIRMAGYTGFRGRSVPMENKLTTPNYIRKFENGLSVYASSSTDVANLQALDGTNVIVIRGALEGDGSSLIMPAETGKLTVALRSTRAGACPGNGTSYNGLCVDGDLMIADAMKVIVFKPSKISPNGTSLEITYAGGWGGDYKDVDTYFDRGAQVTQAETKTYFVKEGVSGEPSLFLRENSGSPQELLEGVSNIAIRFNRSETPNNYADAADSMDSLWSDPNSILSLQLEVLIKSLEDNVLDENQIYSFNSEDIEAEDKSLYQNFSATIALRNLLQ